MKRKIVIYFLLIILFVCLFSIVFQEKEKDGFSSQIANTMVSTLTSIKTDINNANGQLKTLFDNIKKLPISASNMTVYSGIIDKADQEPLLKYSKIQSQIQSNSGMSTDADTNLINALVSKDPSFQTVIDTNKTINSAFSSISSLELNDNNYSTVLQNTTLTPIEKYTKLMTLIQNQTGFQK